MPQIHEIVEIVQTMIDALSDVLSLLDLRSARCTRLEAGGDWSLRFPSKPALKFAAVLRGHCWMMQPDAPPRRLEAGDVFLLVHTPSYVIASDPALAPEDGLAIADWERENRVRHGGADTVLLAGAYVLDERHARLLIDRLPRFMPIPAAAPEAEVLRGTLGILDRELVVAEIGGELMRRRLAEILLVQAFRACSAMRRATASPPSWIDALGDARIGAALNLLHGDPARRWRVGELARAVGMSRSAFAAAFRARVGQTPLDYLLRWRMHLARRRLEEGASVGRVAAQSGYASESAFGAAFKRIYGEAPSLRRAAEAGGRSGN